MDISFIHIHSYRNIEEQSFNLDAEYIFSFDPAAGTISYTKNDKFISGYFSGGNSPNKSVIKNITAIVGQNGSGKSSILEFIGMTFRSWHNFHPAFSFVRDLAVLREGKSIRILHGQNYSDHEINAESGTFYHIPFSFDPIETDHHDFPRTSQNNQTLKNILSFYYSTSMLDRFHETEVNDWDVVNISNAYKYYATQIPTQNDPVLETNYKRLKHPSNFKIEDALRQVVFLAENDNKQYLPELFKTHEYFSISVRQQKSHERTFKELFLILYDKFPPVNDTEFLRVQFLTAIIHGLVYTGGNFIPAGSQTSFLDEFKEITAKNESLKTCILAFLADHPFRNSQQSIRFLDRDFVMYNFRILEKEALVLFLFDSFTEENFKTAENGALKNFIRNLGNRKSIDSMFFNSFKYQFRLEKGKELCQLYIRQLEELTPDFLEIQLDLSSGEAAFINLFSRFHDGYSIAKAKRDSPRYTDVLVMIDEAEAYFHPQWQKKYIKILVQYFESLFGGIPVQIVIATNSPFVSADLPSYNMIFLKPNDDGLCIVSKPQNHADTLGANIYQLFKDAFYLQNGYMGELAKEKIQELIELLNYPKEKFTNIDQEKKNYMLQLIKNIGEPALQRKLTEMYNELEEENDKN